MSSELMERFEDCCTLLQAVGDENRQLILSTLMETGKGMRVLELAEVTHLSRPAVARHVRILQEAGLVRYDKVGTKGYYTFDPEPAAVSRVQNLTGIFSQAHNHLSLH